MNLNDASAHTTDSPPSLPSLPNGSFGYKGNLECEMEEAQNIVKEMIRRTLEIQYQMERGLI